MTGDRGENQGSAGLRECTGAVGNGDDDRVHSHGEGKETLATLPRDADPEQRG